jgi:hypothetical protein
MRKSTVFILLILSVLAACEKEVVESNISKEVVVESYIQPGDSIGVQLNHILLYHDTGSVIQHIENCSISVSINGVKYNLLESDSGRYFLKGTNIHINEYDSLSMSFSYSNITIEASTIIPSKPENFVSSAASITVPTFEPGGMPGHIPSFELLALSWDNSDNSYYMVAVQPVAANPVPIIANDTIFNNNRHMFRNEPSISNSYSVSPMEFKYKGLHRIILYHLTPEYATLYKFSGNTSLNISEPPTNIVNGFGIFTGMNSDTLYVNVGSGK